MTRGVDVSRHNGIINWVEMKSAGIQYAIIRIGWGDNITAQDDDKARRNIDECERVGMPYGLYIYSYALGVSDVQSEVEHMLRWANSCNPTMGIWFDMEDADRYKVNNGLNPWAEANKPTIHNICMSFLNGCRNAGREDAGIYASYSWFTSIMNYNELKQNGRIWVARWGVSTPALECTLWQYTSDGIVAGNGSNRIDLNYYYGVPVENMPPPPVEYDPPETVTVVKGATLTSISALTGVSVDDLVLTNISQYPLMTKNYIQVGWVLKIPRQKANPTFHKVEKGDTLWKIAKTYKTTVNDILLKNIKTYPKIKANYIRVGWRLTL